MPQGIHAFVDFCSLLLFPFLGLLALLRRRAIAHLAAAALLWLALGAVCLWSDATFGIERHRFENAWLLGLGLAAAFLLVAWLKDRRPVARWLKVVMALITLAVFARALAEFVQRWG